MNTKEHAVESRALPELLLVQRWKESHGNQAAVGSNQFFCKSTRSKQKNLC